MSTVHTECRTHRSLIPPHVITSNISSCPHGAFTPGVNKDFDRFNYEEKVLAVELNNVSSVYTLTDKTLQFHI